MTVQKWRKRTNVSGARMGPKAIHSTVLTIEEAAVVVAFRRHTLLPLDDCVYSLQTTTFTDGRRELSSSSWL